jgi:hypothetical protein
MPNETFRVVQDATMPPGRCCVVTVNNGAIIYGGPIGGLTEDMLRHDYALLILHPTDFADGEAFFKKMLN